ncbi:MAG: D-alanine--D-alanine ligase [Myxococcota bacterium]|nr:D-alanine--D-alanine ligase [Myxococcota bacterium]
MSDTLATRLAAGTARVAVLMGGLSTERNVSLKSGKAVLQALHQLGWDAHAVDVRTDVAARLAALRPDVAWIALHGAFGEDGCIQGLLELLRIPYTGSGHRASSIAMDKVATKRMLRGTDVRLIPDATWRHGEPAPGLSLPLVVKAPNGGSTIGIAFATTPDELNNALQDISQLEETLLVERMVIGEEITVAVLEGRALPVVSIRPVDNAHFDFEAKYTEGRTEYLVPAPIPATVSADAQKQAIAAYNLLGLSGIARADFIVDAEGVPWFLEINTLPGMTATSLSPMAAESAGITFPELVQTLLRAARLHVPLPDPTLAAMPGTQG